MTSVEYTNAVETARTYYNSEDADRFYSAIWGGEDIHIGLYRTGEDDVAQASRRTVERIASSLRDPGPETRVIDLGSGYCGAARHLARTHGCRVVAVNLSEVENERARAMNREAGLDHLIDVTDGTMDRLAQADGAFDVAWSQDAILHSDQRARVFSEIARVLRPGGELIFTDPMQADDCPAGVLQPILDRIHLETLGSPSLYRRLASEVGLVEVGFEDLTSQLTMHYSRILAETEQQGERLSGISRDYLARMKAGLRHWIDGGEKRHLAWGIFHFRKP